MATIKVKEEPRTDEIPFIAHTQGINCLNSKFERSLMPKGKQNPIPIPRGNNIRDVIIIRFRKGKFKKDSKRTGEDKRITRVRQKVTIEDI